ncbi:MAG TPA: type II secretion system protein GspM [Steroidobacteraceae bacterium]|jgi:type II secretory pathway component PulM|nr:type II secretion system protein GspM [Steroidobacteraceae bacterium]
MIEQLQRYLLGLTPRERYIVIGGSVVALVLVVLAIVLPLQSRVSAAQERVQQKRNDLVWLRQVGPQLASLQSTRPPGVLNESLAALVDRTARESGFSKNLAGTQASGDGGLNVRIDKMAFDAMVTWLSQLHERYGVSVDTAAVDSAGEPGTVSATLVLRAG